MAPEGITPEFSVVEEIFVPAHRNLRDARVVVSGGMGAGLQAWRPIESIACLLDGAVACTRPVYQSGLRGYFEHVGQTGEKIAPRLYIAAGTPGHCSCGGYHAFRTDTGDKYRSAGRDIQICRLRGGWRCG